MPVREAVNNELLPVSHMLARAFIDRPKLGEFLHPYRDKYPNDMYLYFLRKLREAYARGPVDNLILVSFEDDEKGTITGTALWHRKRSKPVPRTLTTAAYTRATDYYNYVESFLWPNRAIEPSSEKQINQLHAIADGQHTGSRADVWHLDLLAVDPACGGKGYGRDLVAWGFTQAKKDGVGCSVIAGPGRNTFYRNCGFEHEVDYVDGGCMPSSSAAGRISDGGTLMFWDNVES
ncbi:hypothetical protein BAUCODRAFT_487916 [Baudoinia panamericana UAMH 10762]|uniref:N-acetyltransferase domain-containing protein n=1 Tax=Baudoinia panamericana (strain UAMH 10762) TaxID=717646 RepID=M2NC37_BAUPA|nr:uncharacterized protein BAUCODRAFT_487916 [Baudoinia panamericana UAMH 10762]EMC96734.1 hypothetical protein BAUCODRAFT_487916 [Baudoinia panamericana UAMH 10762]